MSRAGDWLQASRLPSQSYIALPLLLGQAIWVGQGGALDLGALVLAQLFGIFDQLYIVFANDYADQATDRLNQTPTLFSGGSRVLVEGHLSPTLLLRAGQVAAALALVVSLALGVLRGAWSTLGLALLAILFLWLYSFPPAKLSYRGGGESLQMLGVGGVLPLYGYVAQAGSWAHFPWVILTILLPTHLAAALATTLPDAPSDKESEKRTSSVLLGGTATSALILGLNLLSCGFLAQGAWIQSGATEPPLGWLAIPIGASMAQLALFRSGPGSRGMTARVGLAVLATLSQVILMTAVLFR